MDTYGVKYVNKQNAAHLISVLKQHYNVPEVWEGERYIVMHLYWEYKKGKCISQCQDMLQVH